MAIQFGTLPKKVFESEDGLFHAYRLRCHGGQWVGATYRGNEPPAALKTVTYELHGDWFNHPRYGRGFLIREYRRDTPPDQNGERPALIGSLKTIGHFPN